MLTSYIKERGGILPQVNQTYRAVKDLCNIKVGDIVEVSSLLMNSVVFRMGGSTYVLCGECFENIFVPA